MKILVYPHDLAMGGSQTNAIELAAAVSRLGHETVVFGRRGTLCARVDELGLEFIESPDPGRRPSSRVAAELRSIARNRGIDVIHGYEWPPGLEATLAAEPLADTAAVCTVMSMAVAPFLPKWLPLVVGTQQINAVEQARGRLDVNLIEPPVDLEHNTNVDEATVERFRREWCLDDRPAVVCVSRLVPELKAEGILTAIRVAETLAGTAPFQLVIVGDGKARGEMERAAELTNTNVGRRTVTFTGELRDPRAAYGAADVVLGMGGSALRSLAFEKPLVVQGEHGFFRRLSPQSVDLFRWQGWYGVGAGSQFGTETLVEVLTPLLTDPSLRADLAAYGRRVVEGMSLAAAAERQVTIYRDAVANRGQQKRQVLEAGRSAFRLSMYYVNQRIDRSRGRQRADDFNAEPVARLQERRPPAAGQASPSGPILYFPGVGWDTLAGTDRQLATALAESSPIVWVDTPHSILRKRDRVLPAVSHPQDNVVRLRASTFAGVQRPGLRYLANWRRARAAHRYLQRHDLRPRAVVASSTSPMLHLLRDLPGTRVYYATDDFVEAANLWGVGKRYLSVSREKNLRAADMVLAVTPELARHLQRGPAAPRCLPNGADLQRFADIDLISAADVPLQGPIAGVIGQFNARTDLALLEAVQRSGTSLLLVGPRWFHRPDDNESFDNLVSLPHVHWIDELPRDQLAPYLRCLDVGLTPYADSMFNRRSYPLKTLEYLAAGVPVVTTDIASLNGLDRQFVSAEGTFEGFTRRVATVAGETHPPTLIRRSVAASSWKSRAEVLLAWLDPEPDALVDEWEQTRTVLGRMVPSEKYVDSRPVRSD